MPFEDNLKIVLFIAIGIFLIRATYLFFTMRKALESFERRIDEMEGKEQLEEIKERQRREMQIKRQNHMLMRMAGIEENPHVLLTKEQELQLLSDNATRQLDEILSDLPPTIIEATKIKKKKGWDLLIHKML